MHIDINFVRVFAVCKSNIKANKNVTAHLSHVKNKRDTHSPRHTLGVKGLLAADWSTLQTPMNMSFLIIVANG